MNELADIIEPVPPAVVADPYGYWLALGALLVALALTLYIAWRRTAARRHARRRLRGLRNDVARAAISPRELAYRLATDLRTQMYAPRLRADVAPTTALTPEQRQAWVDLISTLDTLRYQPGAHLDPARMQRLIFDCAYWLRRLK